MYFPRDLFFYILSYRDPFYELAHLYRAPSAHWTDEYTILAPCSEYEVLNGRIVSLHWERPHISVRAWGMGLILHMPLTRASF